MVKQSCYERLIRCYYFVNAETETKFGLNSAMKVYTVSDVHVDYPENMDWILSLNSTSYLEDILVLAGDVSHNLKDLTRVLHSLKTKFKAVHFIPGNHELWVENGKLSCSLEKFEAVRELCDSLEVKLRTANYGKLSVVPLFSWYDFSFGEPDRYLTLAWRDFRACSWPVHLGSCVDVNDHFLELNREQLDVSNEVVISYSHFLPRIDVMPSYIPEDRRRIYPVLGSDGLGEQLKQLNPDIHIYGHSHVNQSVELEKIRYVNNAFARPTENQIARKQLFCVLELDF